MVEMNRGIKRKSAKPNLPEPEYPFLVYSGQYGSSNRGFLLLRSCSADLAVRACARGGIEANISNHANEIEGKVPNNVGLRVGEIILVRDSAAMIAKDPVDDRLVFFPDDYRKVGPACGKGDRIKVPEDKYGLIEPSKMDCRDAFCSSIALDGEQSVSLPTIIKSMDASRYEPPDQLECIVMDTLLPKNNKSNSYLVIARPVDSKYEIKGDVIFTGEINFYYSDGKLIHSHWSGDKRLSLKMIKDRYKGIGKVPCILLMHIDGTFHMNAYVMEGDGFKKVDEGPIDIETDGRIEVVKGYVKLFKQIYGKKFPMVVISHHENIDPDSFQYAIKRADCVPVQLGNFGLL